MPKRPELNSIMVIGSGPIVIGQACEFDYSGTQACKALREEGCRIILLNSNPATVMTDTAFSDRTYMEPMTLDMAADILRRERPDAVLPTLGGQTALNLAMELHNSGILNELGIEMIGARPESIELAENRERFRDAMRGIGLDLPRSGLAHTVEEAREFVKETGFPAIIRPSYTLGGTGGGIAYNKDEFERLAAAGLEASPIHQVLVEESVLGWKEIELEVVRDNADNAVVICGIENLDPMGVHTGDSITVAPIQTLSDVEYQALREDALAVVRAVGVDTGGCNIQFAVNPRDGRRVVIEMNPRVSRSSALASKATGFPIARIAAKLALGYRLDELKNDITGTSACFEPVIDYCVVKVPRFNFEKFVGSSPVLGLQMHSVGETMAMGGNFREALQKALRGLETGLSGLEARPGQAACENTQQRLAELRRELYRPGPERILQLYEALTLGLGPDEAANITGIDPWFIAQLLMILGHERDIRERFASKLIAALQRHHILLERESAQGTTERDALIRLGQDALQDLRETLREELRAYKAQGFSDKRLARLLNAALPSSNFSEDGLRALRELLDLHPCFRTVDTCAGEFAAATPYFYSTYDADRPDPTHALHLSNERTATASFTPSGKILPRKIIILGGGPNRIGQGVEFDYCCVQACFAMRELGVRSIMVNSNPETVSTDYDTADSLYFEPVTTEDVLAICRAEKPDGVIVQFGGQTPLNIAAALEKTGVPILGTQPAGIRLAEDREAFSELVTRLGLRQPASGMAGTEQEACTVAGKIGYPVMVRPSFVLGGRAMRIIHGEADLRAYIRDPESGLCITPATPILVDKFLEEAVEVDVDAVVDRHAVTIASVMEHIEQAGIHSGDSCCSIPPHTLTPEILGDIRDTAVRLGLALSTEGLLNVQLAVHKNQVYIIEANPRASRTVPFVSRSCGVNVAGTAAKVMAGFTLDELNFTREPQLAYHCVKEAVLPFERFPGSVISLGPEMRSTGEVMGIDRSFGMAFLKAQAAAGMPVPTAGNVVLTVTDSDKAPLVPLAARLVHLGFHLYATPGTQEVLRENGIHAELVVKIGLQRPHLLDFIRNGEAAMVVNTVSGPTSAKDATAIRAAALTRRVAMLTTLAALRATVEGLEIGSRQHSSLAPLQAYYAGEVTHAER